MTAELEERLLAAVEAQREELRDLRRVLARAHAPRSGPVDTSTACAILGCADDILREHVNAGTVKTWPKKFGKEKLYDAASVWRLLETPAPRARRAIKMDVDAEAEAIERIKID